MRKILYLLALTLSMSSCATIFNNRHQNVTIYTSKPSTIIYQNDTVHTVDNKVTIQTIRQKKRLKLTAISDSIRKSMEVSYRDSWMYWQNYQNYFVGMLVDKDNPKRYAYPQKIHIYSQDTVAKYYRYGPANYKGELYYHTSYSPINVFQFSPEGNGVKNNTGMLGMTTGIDYYHSKKQFVSVVMDLSYTAEIGWIKTFIFPRFVRKPYESMASTGISISNNHKMGRYSVGYGITYAANTWKLHSGKLNDILQSKYEAKKVNHVFGFNFPIYYQAGERFHIGVVYRPTIYKPSTDELLYEHIIRIETAWKYLLKR